MVAGNGPPLLDGARVLERFRVWAPVTKAAVLVVLPLPLLLAIPAALIAGEPGRVAASTGALAAFWTAAVLSWRGLVAEARYRCGEAADLPAAPFKLISAMTTAVGAGAAAVAGGHTAGGIGAFAATALIGHLAFFGRDLRPRRVTVMEVDGVDADTIARQLEQAHGRLRRIDAATRSVAVPEFVQRLGRITTIGRDILRDIEENPRLAARARRFLSLYLDSTERVTAEYARTHTRVASPSLEENFRQLLVDMEGSFADQRRKLLESEAVTLDVEIEVLNARLRREGIGEPLETRQ